MNPKRLYHKAVRFIRHVHIHPLLFMAVTIILTYLILYFAGVTSFDPDNAFDRAMVMFIAFLSGLAAAVMLLRTEWKRWTILSTGLFGFLATICVLYIHTSYSMIYGDYPLRRELIVGLRSVLIISGSWFIAGLIQEWWYEDRLSWHSLKHRLRHPILTYRNKKADYQRKDIDYGSNP